VAFWGERSDYPLSTRFEQAFVTETSVAAKQRVGRDSVVAGAAFGWQGKVVMVTPRNYQEAQFRK